MGTKDRRHQEIIHQDSLMWSRAQTLIAIQAGTLAGIYVINDGQWLLKVLLAFLGIVLTSFLIILRELDRSMREDARTAYDEPCAITDEPPGGFLTGRFIFWTSALLLMGADVLLVYVLVGAKHNFDSPFWKGAGIGFIVGLLAGASIWYFRTLRRRGDPGTGNTAAPTQKDTLNGTDKNGEGD